MNDKNRGVFSDTLNAMSAKELELFDKVDYSLRLDDMSFNNHLRVGRDGEGDIALTIVDSTRKQVASLEFCNSGGRSSNTFDILPALKDEDS